MNTLRTYAGHALFAPVANNMLRLFSQLLVAILLTVGLGISNSQAAEITTLQVSLTPDDEGYRLSSSYEFTLNKRLEDTLLRGVPLYFTTEVQLTRKRWYWLDEVAISASRTTRIVYNVLTGQYHASVDGQLQRSFPSLDDALALIRRPARWIIGDKQALQPATQYTVTSRMRLDVSQLPKPFQINAINDNDWRFSSDWTTFLFETE
jgi:hypothetical protein